MRHFRIMVYAAAVSVAITLSCSREAPLNECAAPEERRLDVEATVSPDTRASITGTDFPKDATMGLFICKSGSYLPHTAGMDNMRATRGETSWSYSLSTNLSISTGVLAITTKADCNADVYAYAPWMEGITNLEEIPYDAASQGDLMYAEENASATANRDIDPGLDDPYTVRLRFRHALSRIRVGVRLARTGYYDPYMSSLTLRKTSAGTEDTRLYSNAVFNAIDGTFEESSLRDTAQLVVNIPHNYSYKTNYITSSVNYLYNDLLVIPTEVSNDGDLELVLGIEDSPLADTYKIQLDDISNDGETGFKAGCTYTFEFTIDNYLRLVPDSIFISDEWPAGETIEVSI